MKDRRVVQSLIFRKKIEDERGRGVRGEVRVGERERP